MKTNKLLYNQVLRMYNKCTRRLAGLVAFNKNLHRQSVLQKHIERMYQKLMNLQASFKPANLVAALVLGAMAFTPNEANAQITFSAAVTNPFGLIATGNSTYASPTFADLDNDGDLDMLTGLRSSDLKYYVTQVLALHPLIR